MSAQTLAYIEEMKKMYFVIMEKYFNSGELSDLDVLFLEAYKRTIQNDTEISFNNKGV